MVLPFGLGSDGRAAGDSIENNNSCATDSLLNNRTPMMNVPTAPPAFLMPGQTNVSTVVPVIPSPYIDFIVVNGDDRYMIRCERKAVLENSVELARLIHAGPNSGRRGDNHFQISNVDKHDFELVIRFLETKFVKYRDHLHIIKILELADRYNCPDLVIHCIRELDLQLTGETVIDVFRALWFYQKVSPPNHRHLGLAITSQDAAGLHKSSKRTKSNTSSIGSNNQQDHNSSPFTAEEFGASLLHNALQLIDMHAELVLTMPQMSELRFEELELIANREAMQLSTELVLINCLAEWSLAECQRKKLEPMSENRRRVLGPLCYAPRFLLMTSTDFRKGCERIELLDTTEVLLVNDAIEGKKMKNLSESQSQLLDKFRTPRPEFTKMPIHLSDRSNPKNYPKRMRRAEKNSTNGEDTCLGKCSLNCLSVFAAIFD